MRNIGNVSGITLKEASINGDRVTYSVLADNKNVGNVSFLKYYEPTVKAIEPYVALWAGSALCVIDRAHATMHCVDRDDETHSVHDFDGLWIVEGELNVDLFDPRSIATLATYYHNEIITSSTLADGLVHISDFAGVAVTLDPRRSLQVVRSTPASAGRN